MSSSDSPSHHPALSRTVFISRILAFIPNRLLFLRFALVTSSWDTCIYEDIDLESYIKRGVQEGSPPSTNPDEALQILKYCFDFAESDFSRRRAEHHQVSTAAAAEAVSEKSGSSTSSSSPQKPTRGGRGKGHKHKSSSSKKITLVHDDDDQSIEEKKATLALTFEDFSSESENARRYVLTRRLRLFLLRAFGFFDADKNNNAEALSLFTNDELLFPSSLSCMDQNYYCFVSGSDIKIFRKQKMSNSSPSITTANNNNTTNAESSILFNLHHHAQPNQCTFDGSGDEQYFEDTKSTASLRGLNLFPRPQPLPSFYQHHHELSSSYNKSGKAFSEMIACARRAHPAPNGVTAISAHSGKSLINRLHLNDEKNCDQDFGFGVARADKGKHASEFADDFDGGAFVIFKDLSWTSDGRYLIGPADDSVLVYDFETEMKSRLRELPRDDGNERPVNTFLVDLSEAHPAGQIRFVACSSSPIFSSSSYADDDDVTGGGGGKRKDVSRSSFMAVVSGIPADGAHCKDKLSFWDLSNLHEDYTTAFKKQVEADARIIAKNSFNHSYQISPMPLRNEITIPMAKAESTVNNITFVDGCFYTSLLTVRQEFAVMAGSPDHNNRQQEYVEEKDDATVFITLQTSKARSGGHEEEYVSAFTTDGYCVWDPQPVFKDDKTFNTAEKNAKANLNLFDSRRERFLKLAITTDESVESSSGEKVENNCILAVAGSRGTIMLLRRELDEYCERTFYSYYQASMTTSAADFQDNRPGPLWRSQSQASNSLSHQHIIHSATFGHEIIDIKFVPKNPAFVEHHRNFGSLLLSVSAAAKNTCFIWRLLPRTTETGSDRTDVKSPNFLLLRSVQLSEFTHHNNNDNQFEIASVACMPKLRVWKDESGSKKQKMSKVIVKNNDDDDDDDDDDNNNKNDNNNACPFAPIIETSVALSLTSTQQRGGSNKIVFFTISQIAQPSTTVLVSDVELKKLETDDNTNATMKNSIIRVCVVRADDEGNERDCDYVETEDFLGNIQRHRV